MSEHDWLLIKTYLQYVHCFFFAYFDQVCNYKDVTLTKDEVFYYLRGLVDHLSACGSWIIGSKTLFNRHLRMK